MIFTIFSAVRMRLSCSWKQLFAFGSTTEVKYKLFKQQSSCRVPILAWSSNRYWNGMGETITVQCMMQLGFTVVMWQCSEGTANFLAAEVTVWTRRSCQTVSPMAWKWGYGKWPDMEIYLQHWSPIFLYWYGSLWMLHLSNHTCIGLCRLNHSHAYLFYIIYDGTLGKCHKLYLLSQKNSHYTYSTDQDLFLLEICTTVYWRIPASQGSSTYRFANKVPYFSD